LGHGRPTRVEWHPHENIIAVGGEFGVILHSDDFETITHINHDLTTLDMDWNTAGTALAIRHDRPIGASGPRSPISIWDAATQTFIMQLEQDDDALVKSIGWCPNDNYIVGEVNRQPVIWDAYTGQQLQQFEVSEPSDIRADDTVICIDQNTIMYLTETCHLLTFTPGIDTPTADVPVESGVCHFENDSDPYRWTADGSRFTAEDFHHTIHIIDTATGESLVQLQGHTEDVWDLVWVMDETRIVSGGEDGTIRVWDAVTGEQLKLLDEANSSKIGLPIYHTFQILAAQPTTNRLASLRIDALLQVWDLSTNELLSEYQKYVTVLPETYYWSADGERLVTLNRGLRTQVWDTRTGELLRFVNSPVINDEPLAYRAYSSAPVVWSPTGTQFALLPDRDSIEVYDYGSERPNYTLREGAIQFRGAAWNPDGTILAAIGERIDEQAADEPVVRRARAWELWLWDAATGDVITVHDDTPPRSNGAFTWSPDGSQIALRQIGTATIIDTWTGERLVETEPINLPLQDPIMWVSDGTKIMGAGVGSTFAGIVFWDAMTGETIEIIDDCCSPVSLHPNGRFIAGRTTPTEVVVQDWASGDIITRYLYPSLDPLYRPVWNPDGTSLAIASDFGPIYVFNDDSLRP
jgi:WD40 repeat protein